jgi:hypothetical protein
MNTKNFVICFLLIFTGARAMQQDSSHNQEYERLQQQKNDMSEAIHRLDEQAVHDLLADNIGKDPLMYASWWAKNKCNDCTQWLEQRNRELKQLESDKDNMLHRRCDQISCKNMRGHCFEYNQEYEVIRRTMPPLLYNHFVKIAETEAERRIIGHYEERRKKLQLPVELRDTHRRDGKPRAPYGCDREGKEPADIHEQIEIARRIELEINKAKDARLEG